MIMPGKLDNLYFKEFSLPSVALAKLGFFVSFLDTKSIPTKLWWFFMTETTKTAAKSVMGLPGHLKGYLNLSLSQNTHMA